LKQETEFPGKRISQKNAEYSHSVLNNKELKSTRPQDQNVLWWSLCLNSEQQMHIRSKGLEVPCQNTFKDKPVPSSRG